LKKNLQATCITLKINQFWKSARKIPHNKLKLFSSLTTTDHITIKALIIKKLETSATQKPGQQRAKEIFLFSTLQNYITTKLTKTGTKNVFKKNEKLLKLWIRSSLIFFQQTFQKS